MGIPPLRLGPKEFSLTDPREICQARFRTFLNIHVRALMISSQGLLPAQKAVRAESLELRKQLGDRFLGLSLGGPLIHDLGTVKTSPVDYFIYTRSLGDKQAERIGRQSRERLSLAKLTPGEDDPVRDLELRPVAELTSAMSVFTNLIESVPDKAALEQAALASIAAAIAEKKVPPREIFTMLMVEFITLTGSNPAYVAREFMANRAPEYIPVGAAEALSLDNTFMERMIAIARPLMIEKVRDHCRFPWKVRALFGK